jgi:hypothetical protein
MTIQKKAITKSFNDELKQAAYVCMIPGTDLHGHSITVEEIRKACHSFNSTEMQANLFHKIMTKSLKYVESYTLLQDLEMEDTDGVTRNLPQGTWVMVTQALTDEIWQAQKSGFIKGLSIGAVGYISEEE